MTTSATGAPGATDTSTAASAASPAAGDAPAAQPGAVVVDDDRDIVRRPTREVGRGQGAAINLDALKRFAAAHEGKNLEGMGLELAQPKPAQPGAAPAAKPGDALELAQPTGGTDAAAAAAAAAGQQPTDPPAVMEAWNRVTAREAELAERELRIQQAEGSVNPIATGLLTDPLAAIRAAIVRDHPEASRDEVDAEVSYQVTQMSLQLAGHTLDPNNPQHRMRQTEHELRLRNAQIRRQQRDATEAATTAKRAEDERLVLGQIGEEFKPLAAKYPWLAADASPQAKLWGTIRDHHGKTGVLLTTEQAAQKADEAIRGEIAPRLQRYQSLLQPAAPGTPPIVTPSPAPDHQRRSPTLTNTGASESTPSPRDGHETLADRERATIAKWSKAFATSDSSGNR